jgi:hypothetical protein
MILQGLDIAEGKPGFFAKTRPWLTNEGVLLHTREWISGAGDNVTAYGLAKAVGEYFRFLESSKDNYWNGEFMIEKTIRAALPIFGYAFPRHRGFLLFSSLLFSLHGVWAFGNASNHNIYATNPFITSRMSLGPGAQTQPRMREGLDNA